MKKSMIKKNLHNIAFCFIWLISFSAQAGTDYESRQFISVVGQGSVQVVPNEISFVVGIDAKQPTVRQAYETVESKMKDALRVLDKLGIDEQSVQAMHISLSPIIDYKQRDRIVAHEARRDINILVDDMEVYARAIEQLSELEITRFQRVTLSSSEDAQLEIKALELAYENAEAKAGQLARNAGKKLRGAVEIIETNVIQQPVPTPYLRSAMLAEADPGASSASVSGGLITVRSAVSVRFEIE